MAGWLRHVLLGLLLCVASTASAQGIESVLAPGKLSQHHAKAEADCNNCHRKFDREAQTTLCGDCHKDVRADIQQKRGFHGRQKPQACRSCHTEHKGREFNIAALDTQRFDHSQTDYALAGKHVKVECKACHVAGRKWRDAPSECNSCHKKDDVHKAALGTKCQDCHNDSDWKKTSFDHSKTRFALVNKHETVKCSSCHKDQRYQDTPRSCIGCHRKDDEQLVNGRRGHQGQFGEKCESCHTDRAWKPSTFNHDRDTAYALKGKHRAAECRNCHTGHLYRQKLATDCHSCHKKDDKHEGSLGRQCADCHNERGWKDQGKFDHDKTSFPLLGKHADARCESCHKSTVFKDAPKDCVACHLKDDKHESTLGRACGDCHQSKAWKDTRGLFDHDKTRFALRNAHAVPTLECKACHRDAKSFRNTATDCVSCHRQDDKHEGQQGARCGDCHNDQNWKQASRQFDHSKSRFALTGKHVVVACGDCHSSPRFKEAPRDCYSCHQKSDKHKRSLGVQCESCHSTRAWSLWTFDHDRQTDYRLAPGHRTVVCAACHSQPAPPGKATAPLDRRCVACHRKDDVHDGSFGARCEQCHVADKWKKITQSNIRTGGYRPQNTGVMAHNVGNANDSQSIAHQLGANAHLPLKMLVLVNSQEKHVAFTDFARSASARGAERVGTGRDALGPSMGPVDPRDDLVGPGQLADRAGADGRHRRL